MSEDKFGTILTKIGKAKISEAALSGNNIELKKLKIGDSNGKYYDPVESQTELKNELYSCEIGSIKIDNDNPNWVIVDTVLPCSVGGFTIREVGICDSENNLIAVSKYPETYKPVIENGAGKDICIRLIIEVSNAENITMNLDPNVIIATKEDINDLQNKINNNSTQLNDLTNDSYPIVGATGTNAYVGSSARIKTVGKGTRCTLFVGTGATGNCSLNLNSSGAAAIKDSNGNIVTNLKANIPYNLCHNGSDFILQGKGGGGNLIPEYLLEGYYGEGDNGRVDGTMKNNGAVNVSLAVNGNYTIPKGYHNGQGKIAQNITSREYYTNSVNLAVNNDYMYVRIPQGAYFTNSGAGYPEILVNCSDIRNLVGLTSDKIVSGNTFFGVTGAATTVKYQKFDGNTDQNYNFTLDFEPDVLIYIIQHTNYSKNFFLIRKKNGDTVHNWDNDNVNYNISIQGTNLKIGKISGTLFYNNPFTIYAIKY